MTNRLYHNIDATENFVKYLANATESDVTLKGRNISTDTLYTSISLAKWHLELNIITVGTLNSNSYGVPDELKTPVDREEFRATCHFDAEKGDFYLNSCTVKTKSKEEMNVLLLSTMPSMLKKMETD